MDHPEAIPAGADPLLSVDADIEGDAWPLGTIATREPDVARDIVHEGIELLTSDRSGPHFADKKLGALIAEVAEGDQSVAVEGLRSILTDRCQKARSKVCKEAPELTLPLVEEAVELMATDDSNLARFRVSVILKTAAELEPDQVRSAVLEHYPDGEAFVMDYDSDSDVYDKERNYRKIARAAGFEVERRP